MMSFKEFLDKSANKAGYHSYEKWMSMYGPHRVSEKNKQLLKAYRQYELEEIRKIIKE